MAVDKLVDSAQLDADLTSVANAIRTKGGTSAQMAFPAGFVSAVQAIPTGITPTGTKQITENGTYDVTQYASAEVNVSGGGGGLTTIASGSFIGNDNTLSGNAGRQQFTIGKKMAKTNFFVLITCQDDAEIAYSSNRKYLWQFFRCDSLFGEFDISTDGNKSFIANDYSVDSNNGGTITTRNISALIAYGKQIYNGAVSDGDPSTFQIRRLTDHFDLLVGITNSAYRYTSECTYSWKVVYYGSNPATDIVELS